MKEPCVRASNGARREVTIGSSVVCCVARMHFERCECDYDLSMLHRAATHLILPPSPSRTLRSERIDIRADVHCVGVAV